MLGKAALVEGCAQNSKNMKTGAERASKGAYRDPRALITGECIKTVQRMLLHNAIEKTSAPLRFGVTLV